jgi:hypothetical protein
MVVRAGHLNEQCSQERGIHDPRGDAQDWAFNHSLMLALHEAALEILGAVQLAQGGQGGCEGRAWMKPILKG